MNEGLSKREQTVLVCLKHGLSSQEIGLALDMSLRTVQRDIQRIYLHLGVQTRADAVVRLQRLAK